MVKRNEHEAQKCSNAWLVEHLHDWPGTRSLFNFHLVCRLTSNGWHVDNTRTADLSGSAVPGSVANEFACLTLQLLGEQVQHVGVLFHKDSLSKAWVKRRKEVDLVHILRLCNRSALGSRRTASLLILALSAVSRLRGEQLSLDLWRKRIEELSADFARSLACLTSLCTLSCASLSELAHDDIFSELLRQGLDVLPVDTELSNVKLAPTDGDSDTLTGRRLFSSGLARSGSGALLNALH